MKKKGKNEVLKRYGKAAGIGLIATAAIAVGMGLLGAENEKEMLRTLSNACMCGSGILVACWCFLWAGKNGILDWAGYSFGSLAMWISSLWGKGDPDRIGREGYGDYVEELKNFCKK